MNMNEFKILFKTRKITRYFTLFFISSIIFASHSIPFVYGIQEDTLEIRKKAVYEAEWAFSQAVIKAKQEYMKVISDPNADAKTKAKADAIKDKAIADAKIIKDKSIEMARQNYAQTIKIESSQSKIKTETQKQPFCFLWWCF